MSKVLVNESSLSGIADAIRSKLGVSTKYKPSQMAVAIDSIEGGTEVIPDGYVFPTGTKEITANGTYDVTNFANALVNVESGGSSGSDVLAWADSAQIVTIGDNAVTSTLQVQEYFSGYDCTIVMLLSDITVDNQFFCMWKKDNSTWIPVRYRNGYINSTSFGANYDAVLVKGTQYLVATY